MAQEDTLTTPETDENPPSVVEPTPDKAPDEAPAKTSPPEEEMVYVTFPDGSLHAVPRSVVLESQAKNAAAFAGGGAFSLSPAKPDKNVSIQLSDGTFHEAKESELPGYAGTNAPLGFWEVDGKTHFIIAVHEASWDSKEG